MLTKSPLAIDAVLGGVPSGVPGAPVHRLGGHAGMRLAREQSRGPMPESAVQPDTAPALAAYRTSSVRYAEAAGIGLSFKVHTRSRFGPKCPHSFKIAHAGVWAPELQARASQMRIR